MTKTLKQLQESADKLLNTRVELESLGMKIAEEKLKDIQGRLQTLKESLATMKMLLEIEGKKNELDN
jgi:hypothetical protein